MAGQRPPGMAAFGVFLVFGVVMACLAGITLAWPGTHLDRIWALNPNAYNHLSSFGRKVGILFLVLSATLALAAVGWTRRRLWGWRLAVAIIAIQLLGDIVNVFRGDYLREPLE